MIEKPISLIIEDEKNKIINAINEALDKLSPVVVEPMLKLLYLEVLDQKNKTIERDNLDYQRRLFEEQQKVQTNILDTDGNVVDTIES